ncbi:hypothetical protein DVH26_18680 [Paenibacillus sp. H1-7]|nr:hypothetical protein DVH26_18680 [Paenibacillus sp. H1-7]
MKRLPILSISERMIQRLNAIQTSVITDTTSVIQMIVDNKYSLFPQFIETERPDRLVYLLYFRRHRRACRRLCTGIIRPRNDWPIFDRLLGLSLALAHRVVLPNFAHNS